MMALLSRFTRRGGCFERTHEHLHSVVQSDESAELHDLGLAVVLLQLRIERGVYARRVQIHLIGIS